MREGYQRIFSQILDCLNQREPVALVTVIETKGSAPASPGNKMLVFKDGSIEGSVGGGPLEKMAIEKAQEAIDNKQCYLTTSDLNNEDAKSLGMVCGGQAKLFIEPITNSPKLILVGGGHIARELARLAHPLDFQITVIDDREAFANATNFPWVDEVVCDQIERALMTHEIDENTYVVIVTRGHAHDQQALEQVINSKAQYIGMIGSKNKIHAVFDNMKEKGFTDAQLENVYAPIGLNLGGNSPSEIAVSIIAEIIQVKNQGGKTRT